MRKCTALPTIAGYINVFNLCLYMTSALSGVWSMQHRLHTAFLYLVLVVDYEPFSGILL